jgi:hypothetical protein
LSSPSKIEETPVAPSDDTCVNTIASVNDVDWFKTTPIS